MSALWRARAGASLPWGVGECSVKTIGGSGICRHKRQYPTEEAARPYATLYGLACYKCPHCDGYHLTKRAQDSSPEELERERASRERSQVLEQSNSDRKQRALRLARGGKRRRP